MEAKYWVFRCTNCGSWSGKETRKDIKNSIFKCVYCNKSKKISKEAEFELSMPYKGPYDNPGQATIMCQVLNNKRGK